MKVGVIGAGLVGSTAAYALTLQGHANEVVLVDLDHARAEAEAQDISHAMPFASPSRIIAGDYSDLTGSEVVVIAAGVNQRPGESRRDLLDRNTAVFESVISSVLNVVPDPILLIATNPVDVMTTISRRISGLPAHRVIGSGTILDTARFRDLLGRHLGIAPRSLHAYVLGEHGDSEVLGWSGARAGTMPLMDYAETVGAAITDEVRAEIDQGVRAAAYRIIEGKGATYYGIAAGLSRIVSAIRTDECAVLSVSAISEIAHGYPRTAFSLPRVVGERGIVAELEPSLDAEETRALMRSAELLFDLAGEG